MIDQHQTDVSHGADSKRELLRNGEPERGGREADRKGRIAHAIKSSGRLLAADASDSDSLPRGEKSGDTSHREKPDRTGFCEEDPVVFDGTSAA